MATKPTNWQKCIRVSYVVNVVFLIHAAATLVTILREVPYKGWIRYKSVWTNTVHLVFEICSLVHTFVTARQFFFNEPPWRWSQERRKQVGGVLCLLYKIHLYVYAGRSLFFGTFQALAWRDWEKARKLLVGTVSVLVGIRPGYLPEYKQKSHRVKQFIDEPLVLFCCYVVKYCFWALLRSLGERDFFSSQCDFSVWRTTCLQGIYNKAPNNRLFPRALKSRRFHVQRLRPNSPTTTWLSQWSQLLAFRLNFASI